MLASTRLRYAARNAWRASRPVTGNDGSALGDALGDALLDALGEAVVEAVLESAGEADTGASAAPLSAGGEPLHAASATASTPHDPTTARRRPMAHPRSRQGIMAPQAAARQAIATTPSSATDVSSSLRGMTRTV